MKLEPGQVLSVDNAWRLHPYADDEFCIEAPGDARIFVAKHDGESVTILREQSAPTPVTQSVPGRMSFTVLEKG